MPRFRKRPVEITAAQWFKNGDHPDDGPADREGQAVRYFRRPDIPGTQPCRHCSRAMHDHGWIDTLEGGHIVCPGDWIVTGVNSERYPVKDPIFQATYEPVEQARVHVENLSVRDQVDADRIAAQLYFRLGKKLGKG